MFTKRADPSLKSKSSNSFLTQVRTLIPNFPVTYIPLGNVPQYNGPADVANACGVVFAYLQSIPDPIFGDLKQNFIDVAGT